MNSKDDMAIAKKLNLSVMDWHELLSKMVRLDARELNLVAMQLSTAFYYAPGKVKQERPPCRQ